MTRKASIVLWVITLIALFHNTVLPMHPDESYYWVWSRHLQLSYYDAPPMIAYMIKATTLFISTPFTVRLVSVICIFLTTCFIYQFAKRLFNPKVAEISAIVFLFVPFVQVGLSVTTPDLPLMLFWTLSFIMFYDYLILKQEKKIYLVGLFVGLALLSKYPAILLVVSFFIMVVLLKRWEIFKQKSLYVGMVIAIVVFSPVLLWNISNHFASFAFQLGHGASASAPINLSYLGEYLGGQFGAVNPIFFIIIIFVLIKGFKEIKSSEKLLFLFVPFATTFIIFMVFSLNKHSEVNWPAPAYLSIVILMGYFIEKYRLRIYCYIGMVLSIIAFIILIYPGYSPVLVSKFKGYNTLMQAANAYVPSGSIILSDNYQDASEAEYYMTGRPRVNVLTPTRFSQYDLWATSKVVQNIQNSTQPIYFVGTNDMMGALGDYFNTLSLVQTINYNHEGVNLTLYIIQCANISGTSDIMYNSTPIPAY
ncbi:MAG: glycosyltransferase family 39 protein [Fusobacteria bacterium]|nr:glycosyltransferase family 39 protein [Fusobacteriota bacterium]